MGSLARPKLTESVGSLLNSATESEIPHGKRLLRTTFLSTTPSMLTGITDNRCLHSYRAPDKILYGCSVFCTTGAVDAQVEKLDQAQRLTVANLRTLVRLKCSGRSGTPYSEWTEHCERQVSFFYWLSNFALRTTARGGSMGPRGICRAILIFLLALAGGSGVARAQAARGTHSPHGNLDVPCQNCHTADAWRPIRAVPEFDHNQTKYPLRGLHESVACTQCHVKPVFTNVGKHCQDCHADIHKRQLGADCEQCHTVRGWQVSVRQVQQHNNRFPLTGAHAVVDCDSCHKGGATSQFQTLSTECYSCHAADFRSATNPNHASGGFSTSCTACHGTDTWLNAKFDHSASGFPLTGGHQVPPRQCTDCHINNNYNLTSTTCVSCHLKDYQSAGNPNHVSAGFAQTCEQCHNTASWSSASFNHNLTNFPLTGMHTVPPRQCVDCHVNNNYNLTTTSCVSCHLKDYQGTTNPNHAVSNFPQGCEQCHSTTSWANATFNHSSTGFPLSGSHTVPPRQCSDCHINNNYNLSQNRVSSCHQNDYTNAVTSVNHVAESSRTPVKAAMAPSGGRTHIQSCQHRVPVDGRAHGAPPRLRRLSRQQQLLTEQHILLFVPSEGVRCHE